MRRIRSAAVPPIQSVAVLHASGQFPARANMAKVDCKSTILFVNGDNIKCGDPKVVERARRAFDEGRTKDLKFRKDQLRKLLKLVEDNRDAILNALHQDLRKPRQEAISFETNLIVNEILLMLDHVDAWSKPEKPSKPVAHWMDGLFVYREPYGVALVMGAWNYPFQLALLPVIGAIAAGNCVVIKPSDLSPATSQLIADLFPRYLDSQCYPVFLGGIEETTQLLKERFDYIFYTGSTTVGKIVQRAASEYLTPTTLELGGKSPAYIDHTADIEKTVQRILWGKCINSGQTCIAPDYVLCTKQIQDKFVECAAKVLNDFYGNEIQKSPDYCRIINDRNFNRVVNLLSGLKVAIGGRYDAKDRYIEPTIATDVSPNHPIMQDEIFGPILPIVTIRDVNEAISFIKKREKPLALYIFSTDNQTREKILNETSSGGVTVNDTVMHAAIPCLPFGGVGNSGMGAYHGEEGFKIFTHRRSVLVKNFNGILDKIFASRFPPYSAAKIKLLSEGVKYRKGLPFSCLSYLITFLLGVGATIAIYFIYKAYN